MVKIFDLLKNSGKATEKKININLTLMGEPETFRKRECLIERRMGLSNAQSSIFCIFFYQIIPGAISGWAKLRRTPPSC